MNKIFNLLMVAVVLGSIDQVAKDLNVLASMNSVHSTQTQLLLVQK
jgi:hypothetical protein